ncbi:4-alpha-glucanotransferase [Novosphingobium sp. M1R2S20]|uniref:4-alpha-glucanotransferase n=1 Tax=Novosphingobium rhizovicinum TaxID=3228928 RepID=A0ABV3RB26_9SPHN
MSPLHALAEAIGLERVWRDAKGDEQVVSDATLAIVAEALGYPAHNDDAARASLETRLEEDRQPPAFLSADVNHACPLPPALSSAGSARLQMEDGETRDLAIVNGHLPGIEKSGYHTLHVAGHELVFAVAPKRCLLPEDRDGAKAGRHWGTAIQIPSLHEKPAAYGDFGDLRAAVRLFAQRGADAVAISPVHAPNPANEQIFSPYSPSSRLFLNPTLAERTSESEDGGPLIDWAAGLRESHAALRAAFVSLSTAERVELQDWAAARGPGLHRHALHDALALNFADQGTGWRSWPQEYHDPDGAAVSRFATEHAEEVTFHLYAQWLSERSLEAVQQEARSAGMAIGLISDLAVGIDTGGSDAWAMQDVLLEGLTIGAPPDLLGPDGQNWALTSFSPRGLARSAFAPWLAMLRTALRHAGGVRIDHAFGLARLWVVPNNASASHGVYLRYPYDDMLRLLVLESHRAGAVIVGEDLGTRPPGFMGPFADRGILGMRVLWFERDWNGFCKAEDYPAHAIAMTGTHDLATIAGWWRGRDLEWNRRLGRGGSAGDGWQEEERQRAADRDALWSAMGNGAPQPAVDDPGPVIEAALAFLGRTPSTLAIVPLEDLLGLEEQPNLPGTIDEHPNWRRRLAGPLAELLEQPETARHIAALVQARSS